MVKTRSAPSPSTPSIPSLPSTRGSSSRRRSSSRIIRTSTPTSTSNTTSAASSNSTMMMDSTNTSRRSRLRSANTNANSNTNSKASGYEKANTKTGITTTATATRTRARSKRVIDPKDHSVNFQKLPPSGATISTSRRPVPKKNKVADKTTTTVKRTTKSYPYPPPVPSSPKTTSNSNSPKIMMDVLAIPDPPTPDERDPKFVKTAAAAKAMQERRKSRRFSGAAFTPTPTPDLFPSSSAFSASASASSNGNHIAIGNGNGNKNDFGKENGCANATTTITTTTTTDPQQMRGLRSSESKRFYSSISTSIPDPVRDMPPSKAIRAISSCGRDHGDSDGDIDSNSNKGSPATPTAPDPSTIAMVPPNNYEIGSLVVSKTDTDITTTTACGPKPIRKVSREKEMMMNLDEHENVDTDIDVDTDTDSDTNSDRDADTDTGAKNDDDYDSTGYTGTSLSKMKTSPPHAPGNDDTDMDWGEKSDSMEMDMDMDMDITGDAVDTNANDEMTRSKSNDHSLGGNIGEEIGDDDDDEDGLRPPVGSICFDDDSDENVILTPTRCGRVEGTKDKDRGESLSGKKRPRSVLATEPEPRSSPLGPEQNASRPTRRLRQSMLIPNQDCFKEDRFHADDGHPERNNSDDYDGADRDDDGYEQEEKDDEVLGPLVARKKSHAPRRSMVVPSKMMFDGDVDGDTDENSDEENAMDTTQMEEDDDMGAGEEKKVNGSDGMLNMKSDLQQPRKKRGKGRKSMILPAELIVDTSGLRRTGSLLQHYDGGREVREDRHGTASDDNVNITQNATREVLAPTETIGASKPGTSNEAIKDDDDAKMEEIKACIRKFCSLPMEERYKSDDALRVEELTGYKLLTPVDKINRERAAKGLPLSPLEIDWNVNPFKQIENKDDGPIDENTMLVNEMKRNIIRDMTPLVKIMEAKKNDDTSMIIASTGCRTERRKGRFRYTTLTGEKVSSKYYEKRYLEMVRQQRSAKVAAREAEKKRQAVSLLTKKKIEEMKDGEDNKVASLMHTTCEHNSIHRGEEKVSEKVAKKSEQNPRVEAEKEAKLANTISGPDVDKPLSTSGITKSHPALHDPNQDIDLDIDEKIDIPLKDQISSDPEIAAAQKKLHEAFDVALREYSATVLRIRAKRKLVESKQEVVQKKE